MNDDKHWLEIPAEILKLEGVLWVREPDDASLMDIWASFRDGTYAKPFVHDDGDVRRLHFNFDSMQSEMLLDDECALSFAYTQRMMAFLLFKPRPKQVVIVGLGGGSMTKFCYQQLPDTRITTVEIDEDVIGFSPLFNIPPSDQRHRILHTDAAEYFRTCNDAVDVALIDGCDADGTVDSVFEADFYENLRRALTPDGIVVVNLVGDYKRLKALKKTLEDCFGRPPAEINLEEERNRLLFAFNDRDQLPDWRQIKQQAKELAQQHKLDFPEFARKLQSAWHQ